MKRIPYHIFLFLALGLIVSGACEKSGTNCFSSTGSIIRQERVLPPFDSIEMYDNVSVILTQDPAEKLVVEAGDRIIDGITTEVVNGNLVIHNTNACNWTRSFKNPINVYISTDYLWKVYYNSSGDLSSTNTLDLDSLKVEVWGGCGRIDLDVDIVTGYFSENLGTADFVLSGICGICYIWAGEYGPFNCGDLATRYCFVTSKSSNDCRVRVEKILGVTITSIGNVYYTGNPDSISSTITGQGNLIAY